MSRRTKHSVTISNDEIGLQKPSLLSKLLHRHENHRSHSIVTVPSLLYLACQNNDLTRVEICLKKMKPEEIDCQYPPNNETALHVATRNQNKEIIQLLLVHGARRSLKNSNGQEAYELAKTDEIADLFKRPKSSRFAFLHSFYKSTILFQSKKECESCSLVNDDIYYEWELVDLNASQKALRFRYELKPSASMNEKSFKQKLYSINKGYIDARLRDVPDKDRTRIHDYFQRALLKQDPYYIVTAYTIGQKFTELLNKDMARNIIHDLKNGCSRFSCDCLYSTEDGTKSITSILLHHPKFEELNFQGEIYRGIVVPKHTLDHYKVGSCIITTTFLSTSKNPVVARRFCDKGMINPAKQSFFCIYEIVNNDRTAIDISEISEFKQEEEVLILPYSVFLITKIEEEGETTNIYLKEQCLSHIFSSNGSSEYSIKSTARLLEVVGTSLLHKISKSESKEDDISIRPRSKTMPIEHKYF